MGRQGEVISIGKAPASPPGRRNPVFGGREKTWEHIKGFWLQLNLGQHPRELFPEAVSKCVYISIGTFGERFPKSLPNSSSLCWVQGMQKWLNPGPFSPWSVHNVIVKHVSETRCGKWTALTAEEGRVLVSEVTMATRAQPWWTELTEQEAAVTADVWSRRMLGDWRDWWGPSAEPAAALAQVPIKYLINFY